MKLYTRKDIQQITGKSQTAVALAFFYLQIEPCEKTFSLTNRPMYHYNQVKAKKVIDKLKSVHYLNSPKIINEKIANGILCDVNGNELNLIIPSRSNFVKLENL